MTEAFLSYIWKFQYFDKKNLKTTAGDTLSILKTGIQNTDSGADFQQVQIELNGKLWVGSAEIHLSDFEWNLHKHQIDKQYNNVVLHIIWHKESDKIILREDGSVIPTLELKNRVSPLIIEKYYEFISQKILIPCQNVFKQVDNLKVMSMLDNVLVQRLERKAQNILALLEQNTGNWEETTYQVLAQSFGFKINNEPFLGIAKSLPLKILAKHADNLHELEALLFGQSGFLTEAENEGGNIDEYTKELNKTYYFLKYKYKLTPLETHKWKFLRLRPANFPTVRIAQFAVLIHKQQSFFTNFIHSQTAKELQELLAITPSEYWNNHYHLAKVSSKKMGSLGKDSINNLIINTIAPLLAAYSLQKDNDIYIEKAIKILEQLPAENNKITELWEDVGLKVKNAFDAQAAIELYNEFCSKKQCLQCRIGAEIIFKL